ncbi:hypothetical protein IAT38_005528 [Cryptococcus sp. DSM 104549]
MSMFAQFSFKPLEQVPPPQPPAPSPPPDPHDVSPAFTPRSRTSISRASRDSIPEEDEDEAEQSIQSTPVELQLGSA